MARIEVELIGEYTQDEIYDLRNYLRENLPEGDFVIKEQPTSPGQMSAGIIEAVVMGLIHAAVSVTAEDLYRNLIKPVGMKWLHLRESAGSRLELMSSISNEGEKVHFLEDSKGNTQVFNYKYQIDTDKTWVVLIGASKFISDFHSIPPVERNLDDLQDLLSDKTHIGIPRNNIVRSLNESHLEIQKHLLQASRQPGIQTLIVYFAGHGHRTDVKKLSLIATDTEKIGDEIIGGIDFDFISNRIMKNSSATQKILILDTCHSGIATQGAEDLVKNFDVKGSYILASSPADDVSYFERNAQNTFFTGTLLEVLRRGIDNTNEMLALEDLRTYATEVFLEKKFPHPDARSDLNIPPSDFFIARNPAFSSEKLKWRAYNLFRDGKLEEALDELRKLVKRYPEDENLRKQFENCETELSFSNLVNQANTLFYEKKDFKQAGILYKKAYGLKTDAMVMEKIRQCEKQGFVEPVDPLKPIKGNPNFQAYQKASERRAYYTAFQYLKKVKQDFPNSEYVKDEFAAVENKLKKISDAKSDERLVEYYRYLESGDLKEAMTELKVHINNDPEYPVLLQLQRALGRRIREQEDDKKKKRTPLLFRLFETMGRRWQMFVLLGIAAVLALVIVMYIKSDSKKTISELKEMLTTDPTTAISILQKKGEKNDSALLVLGDYFRSKEDYHRAFYWYEYAKISGAMSAIGEMWYKKQLDFKYNLDSIRHYFKKALQFGIDTTASTYLGIIARSEYDSYAGDVLAYFMDLNKSWNEAEKNFLEGYKNGSLVCQQQLGEMYYEKAEELRKSRSYKIDKSLTPSGTDSVKYYFEKAAAKGNQMAIDSLRKFRVY